MKSRLSLSVNDLTTHFKETVSEKLTQDGELIHHVLYRIVYSTHVVVIRVELYSVACCQRRGRIPGDSGPHRRPGPPGGGVAQGRWGSGRDQDQNIPFIGGKNFVAFNWQSHEILKLLFLPSYENADKSVKKYIETTKKTIFIMY